MGDTKFCAPETGSVATILGRKDAGEIVAVTTIQIYIGRKSFNTQWQTSSTTGY